MSKDNNIISFEKDLRPEQFNVLSTNRVKELIGKITYVETCAGIGVTALVLRRLAKELGIDFECVGFSEIDELAIRAYDVLNPGHPPLGDMTQIDWTKCTCDLLSLTFPCTDISVAGKSKGFEENVHTASSLVWELKNILNKMPEKPKIIFMENVAAILNKRHKPTFDKLINYLESEGYFVKYAKIDAARHGVPQHRERTYILCTYGEEINFSFPQEKTLDTKLCDILEKDVDKKYNLKGLKNYFIKHSMETPYTFRVHNPSHCDVAYTVTTRSGSRISDNYIIEKDLSNDKVIRIKPKNLEKAGLTIKDIEDTNIRKLTPTEVMTLFGLTKEEQDKLKDFSDTAIYKLMGNSIVIPVLEDIFREYFKAFLGKDDKDTKIS